MDTYEECTYLRPTAPAQAAAASPQSHVACCAPRLPLSLNLETGLLGRALTAVPAYRFYRECALSQSWNELTSPTTGLRGRVSRSSLYPLTAAPTTAPAIPAARPPVACSMLRPESPGLSQS